MKDKKGKASDDCILDPRLKPWTQDRFLLLFSPGLNSRVLSDAIKEEVKKGNWRRTFFPSLGRALKEMKENALWPRCHSIDKFINEERAG